MRYRIVRDVDKHTENALDAFQCAHFPVRDAQRYTETSYKMRSMRAPMRAMCTT